MRHHLLSYLRDRFFDSFSSGGLSPLAHAGRRVVPPAAAHGATVAFEAAA